MKPLTDAPHPPRVLLVMPEQWHRALVRAQLREQGYDALGAPDVAGALLYPAREPGRSAVRLIIVDQRALTALGNALLPQLLERHGAPAVLITTGAAPPAEGPWAEVLRRPLSVGDIVRVVHELLPGTGASEPIE